MKVLLYVTYLIDWTKLHKGDNMDDSIMLFGHNRDFCNHVCVIVLAPSSRGFKNR